MNSKKIAVIGGGPAGMMAAATAAIRGLDVTLFEKNHLQDQVLLGKKLLITGNGRCNITNNTDVKGLMANIPTNPRFLHSAFYCFGPSDLIDIMKRYGVPVKVEDRNRVLPMSDKSKDVVNALKQYMSDQGVKVYLQEIVSVQKEATGQRFILQYKNPLTKQQAQGIFDAVVITTGGKSYPQTGSTGDGYKFAKQFGHSIVTPKAALVPLETSDAWVKSLQGVALRDVAITVYKAKKEHETKGTHETKGSREIKEIVFKDSGDILFTHYGLTGPVMYSASPHMQDFRGYNYSVEIDMFPSHTVKEWEQQLLKEIEANGKKQMANVLQGLIPKKMIPILLDVAEIHQDKVAHQITQKDRKAIVRLTKSMAIQIKRLRPIEEATVTSGGVDIQEINPSTMESKLVEGLYFAGEVIDVDGYTGGFNLQIAFSTGYIAGHNILR
ncbi:hypothetical protein BHU72_04385 [Desulfuribacillus stibiiarsenatis]|uniref:FAD-dependent oxidoreductase n=1 Tax=Desulfuribacillus stibiiarsenatis TaxID=1390249 RepID=A0A1E5L6C9_9FIRM|nr:hypothetical protein BHU72_04385 [Desulfuribacillus stibiiarsenatis]